MKVLAIDTSCDETSVAVTEGRRVLSHVEYTQTEHREWGGVVPSIAKRAHQERIDAVVERTFQLAGLSQKEIDAVAVTIGPGLAIALEVGVTKAKEIVKEVQKPLIAVNHMEGHIYSCFVQDESGNPEREFTFPYLALLVSGGHTELVLFSGHGQYKIIGQTRDDAIGEAFDKAARMLGYGYPGGPEIEKKAKEVENKDAYRFPRPMTQSHDLDFSYAGLKTSFMYYLRGMEEEEKKRQSAWLASSFQEAAFGSLVKKTEKAMKEYKIQSLLVGGGVAVNKRLQSLLVDMAGRNNGTVLFPPQRYLTMDNAAMIGVSAYYKAKAGLFALDVESVDRVPRLSLS